MTQPNQLVGKTVTAVYLAKDKMAIRFGIEGGESILARADGDCCSHTWIEGIDDPEALLGKVVSVGDIPMPDLGSPDDYEVIAYYGTKIVTENGTCVIDYRNESNGYYGGNLVWGDDCFYGGVFNQNKSSMEWEKIA